MLFRSVKLQTTCNLNNLVEVAGGLKLDSVSLTTVQIASESFADNDTSLMTSAAIADYVTANSSTLNAALTELGTMPTTTAGALADLTLAEVVVLDGVTAGTVIASKGLVADANIDITGGRNITISGELDAATGDFSGDVDIDGTANLDVVDIDGATQIDATVTVGVDDTGYDVKFFGATASAYMLWDESADDLILAGAAGLEIPNAGRFILGSNVVMLPATLRSPVIVRLRSPVRSMLASATSALEAIAVPAVTPSVTFSSAAVEVTAVEPRVSCPSGTTSPAAPPRIKSSADSSHSM